MKKRKKSFKVYALFACLLLQAMLLRVNAQTAVGSEFHGRWEFDHAVTQEKHVTAYGYTPRTVHAKEFSQKFYFEKVPTVIILTENEFSAYVSGEGWAFTAFAAIVENGDLEFREAMGAAVPLLKESEEGEALYVKDAYSLIIRFSEVVVDENTLSVQYYYNFGVDRYHIDREGTITLYYNKQR
jgi:hypothetical protein